MVASNCVLFDVGSNVVARLGDAVVAELIRTGANVGLKAAVGIEVEFAETADGPRVDVELLPEGDEPSVSFVFGLALEVIDGEFGEESSLPLTINLRPSLPNHRLCGWK